MGLQVTVGGQCHRGGGVAYSLGVGKLRRLWEEAALGNPWQGIVTRTVEHSRGRGSHPHSMIVPSCLLQNPLHSITQVMWSCLSQGCRRRCCKTGLWWSTIESFVSHQHSHSSPIVLSTLSTHRVPCLKTHLRSGGRICILGTLVLRTLLIDTESRPHKTLILVYPWSRDILVASLPRTN